MREGVSEIGCLREGMRVCVCVVCVRERVTGSVCVCVCLIRYPVLPSSQPKGRSTCWLMM